MDRVVSKSKFKARALEYLRQVERTGGDLVITDHGKPAVRIVPYRATPEDALQVLRGSLVRYDDPTEPVALEDWEATR